MQKQRSKTADKFVPGQNLKKELIIFALKLHERMNQVFYSRKTLQALFQIFYESGLIVGQVYSPVNNHAFSVNTDYMRQS